MLRAPRLLGHQAAKNQGKRDIRNITRKSTTINWEGTENTGKVQITGKTLSQQLQGGGGGLHLPLEQRET